MESPPLTAEKTKAVDWPGNEKERERLFRARFLSLIVCPLRFEYAHSKKMRKMLQPLALLAFSLFFLFAIKCISNGTTVQKAFLIKKEFHCL